MVQYCPDRSRGEAVNVGLVLLCADPHDLRVEMTTSHARVQKLFGIKRPEIKDLQLATHGLRSRIVSGDGVRTPEDLETLAATRANDLRMTEPRLAKLSDFDADFDRLFSELVEDRSAEAMAASSPAEVLPPELSATFYRLQAEHRIWKPRPVIVPKFGRRMDVPYAYRNGVINLIKPVVFAGSKRAQMQAATLAVNGDLIAKHPTDGEQRRLIIVSAQEDAEQAKEVREHVEPLFGEYGVKLVRPDGAEAFAEEVAASAH